MKPAIKLSKRLMSAVSMVTGGHIVADIGCDHAYTSIYLIENGISPYVYASDVNEGPVKRALGNIEVLHMEKFINLRRADGMSDLKEEYNIQTVLICGMGGNLMIDILDNDLVKKHSFDELILQPQSDIHKVRHFLHDNEYKIVNEMMVFEDGKFYNIMKAVQGHEEYAYEYEYVYGRYLIQSSDSVFKDYLEYKLNKNKEILASIKCNPNMTDNQNTAVDLIEEDNEIISKILNQCHHGR